MPRSVVLLVAVLAGVPAVADDAASPEVKAAIRRGTEALKKNLQGQGQGEAGGGAGVLAALALVKAGEAPDGPEVAAVLAAVQGRCSASEYKPDGNHYYTAGLELMLLETIDAEQYRGEMEKILAYVLKGQKTSGGWFYPNQDFPGDTSITQYATLGLWAASRANLTVPRETWDKLATWHLRTQLSNGAFTYHPGQTDYGDAPNPALTLGGASSLLLARLHLFRGAAEKQQAKAALERRVESGRRFGVLEAVDLGAEEGLSPEAKDRGYNVEVTSGGIQQAVDRAVAYSAANFALPPNTPHELYYLYGLERMAALGDVRTLGPHDWYDEGSAWLIKTQETDGTWAHDPSGPTVGTAFAVLFLTKSTAKALGRAVGAPELGGGLLAGGRGLPDDLGKVNVKGGNVETRSMTGPLDELLARLEGAQGADVPGVQEAVLEAVRFGDREKLIGERERLLRLVNDPRPEVRRTAFWALGRGGRLEDVPAMIKGLSDPDVSVAVEAHNALCVFSRRPLAFGIPGDPFAGLPEGAAEDVRSKAAAAWREKATAAWQAWYRQVAPYDERDGLGISR